MFETFWLPISYTYQYRFISNTIELRGLYREFLLVIAAFFKRRRDLFTSRSASKSANLLICQLQSFLHFQTQYMNMIETVLFSLIMAISMMEGEYARFDNAHGDSNWEKYCMKSFQWEHILHEHNESHTSLPEHVAFDCLTKVKDILFHYFLYIRPGTLSCYMFSTFIDEMKSIGYDLMQLTLTTDRFGTQPSRSTTSGSKIVMKRLCYKLSEEGILKGYTIVVAVSANNRKSRSIQCSIKQYDSTSKSIIP